MDDRKTTIMAMVTESVAATGIEIEVTEDMSLVESGLLDSFSIVNLVQSLQESFDLDLDFADVTVENFDSVNALASFIDTKHT